MNEVRLWSVPLSGWREMGELGGAGKCEACRGGVARRGPCWATNQPRAKLLAPEAAPVARGRTVSSCDCGSHGVLAA